MYSTSKGTMYSDANKNLPSLIFASSYGYIQMYVCDGGIEWRGLRQIGAIRELGNYIHH